MKLKVLLLGKMEYEKALEIQLKLLARRQEEKIGDTLILAEHPPVITMGRRDTEHNILCSKEYLKQQGISVYKTNRGGDVTYHGKGQAIGYLIINIKNRGIGIKKLVQNIEEVFIQLLKEEYNITAQREHRHTGVWIGNDKINAIGLSVKLNVTMHGFAFNVNTNMEHFKLIVPCGIQDKGVTSLQSVLGSEIEFNHISNLIIKYFCKVFNYESFQLYRFKE